MTYNYRESLDISKLMIDQFLEENEDLDRDWTDNLDPFEDIKSTSSLLI